MNRSHPWVLPFVCLLLTGTTSYVRAQSVIPLPPAPLELTDPFLDPAPTPLPETPVPRARPIPEQPTSDIVAPSIAPPPAPRALEPGQVNNTPPPVNAAVPPVAARSPLLAPQTFPANAGNPTYDDTARFIAGMNFRQNSGYTPFEGSQALANHRVACRDLAQKWETLRLSPMRAWARTQIAPRTGNPNTLFYMFGGPDFIHPATLFPDTREFILAGLEPIGTIPDFYKFDHVGLDNYLIRLRSTLRSISMRSFFETKEMREDFGPTGLDGVFPVLLYFTVLSGNEVVDAQHVSLAKDGSLQKAGSNNATGIYIRFRKLISLSPEPPPEQVLFYFKTDLSNDGIKSNPRFLAFLNQRKSGGSYHKAASYLMHEGGFSTIRDFLLQRSSFILQDESGIPFRFLNQRPWKYDLFGRYVAPVEIFSKYDQPDLRQAFTINPVGLLPFGTGYRRTDDESIQILAIRK